jgi:hypothetical protein
MPDEPGCVWKANGEAEAQQVRSFLRAHDIPCEFRGEALRVVYGFTVGFGVVQICVPAHLEERARELLARVEAGELELPAADATAGPEG